MQLQIFTVYQYITYSPSYSPFAEPTPDWSSLRDGSTLSQPCWVMIHKTKPGGYSHHVTELLVNSYSFFFFFSYYFFPPILNKSKQTDHDTLKTLLCTSYSMANPQPLQLLAKAFLFHIVRHIVAPSSMTLSEQKCFLLMYSCGYVSKNRRLNPRTSLNTFHRW